MAELVVALDAPHPSTAVALATQLTEAQTLLAPYAHNNAALAQLPWMKVGLELFCAGGPAVVEQLKGMGFKVFLDLKFHDIPNTVRGAVRSAVRTGADMVNIHLSGGERMARAAVEGLHEGAVLSGREDSMPLLLGVTVLTSTAAGELPGIDLDIASLVTMLASKGSEWGLHGVVCSGFEVKAIKALCGSSFQCLTPGIRPHGGGGDDQRRVMTPREAVLAGSDYLVVGRPITGAEHPAQAVAQIMLSMHGQSPL